MLLQHFQEETKTTMINDVLKLMLLVCANTLSLFGNIIDLILAILVFHKGLIGLMW